MNLVAKAVLSGSGSVGKTSLFNQLTGDGFVPTLPGISQATKSLERVKDGKNIIIQLWDTAGQEVYQAMNKAYYRGSRIFIAVYDITKIDSFDVAKDYIRTCLDESGFTAPGEVNVILVGNKRDLEAKREVPTMMGSDFAQYHGYKFIEASAKFGQGIEEIVNVLMDIIAGKPELYRIGQPDEVVDINNNNNLEKDKKCC